LKGCPLRTRARGLLRKSGCVSPAVLEWLNPFFEEQDDLGALEFDDLLEPGETVVPASPYHSPGGGLVVFPPPSRQQLTNEFERLVDEVGSFGHNLDPRPLISRLAQLQSAAIASNYPRLADHLVILKGIAFIKAGFRVMRSMPSYFSLDALKELQHLAETSLASDHAVGAAAAMACGRLRRELSMGLDESLLVRDEGEAATIARKALFCQPQQLLYPLPLNGLLSEADPETVKHQGKADPVVLVPPRPFRYAAIWTLAEATSNLLARYRDSKRTEDVAKLLEWSDRTLQLATRKVDRGAHQICANLAVVRLQYIILLIETRSLSSEECSALLETTEELASLIKDRSVENAINRCTHRFFLVTANAARLAVTSPRNRDQAWDEAFATLLGPALDEIIKLEPARAATVFSEPWMRVLSSRSQVARSYRDQLLSQIGPSKPAYDLAIPSA
jgi:hypothetical protein